jgi:hypothetical protein
MSNFDHFVGTRAGLRAACIRHRRADRMATLKQPGRLYRPADGGDVQGRAVQPHLQAHHPGASYVMRAKPGPVAKLLPSAHAIEREFAVMSGLHGTDVPVPRMHVPVRRRIGDRPRLLRDGVHAGPRAVGPVPARHDADRARRHLRRDEPRDRGPAHGEVCRRGLASYGKPGNYFERQIGRWSKQYVASITQPIEEMDRAHGLAARPHSGQRA